MISALVPAALLSVIASTSCPSALPNGARETSAAETAVDPAAASKVIIKLHVRICLSLRLFGLICSTLYAEGNQPYHSAKPPSA